MDDGRQQNSNNNNVDHDAPAQEYKLKDADWALMRAIKRSNYNEVLQALREKANQNYLWPTVGDDGDNDDQCEEKEYADLNAGILALKRVKEENRTNFVWGLASAITRDISRNAVSHVLNIYASQYPMLNYVAPLRESDTAGYLFGSEYDARPVVEPYRPEKRIAQVLLTKDDTDVTIERKAKWHNNPVTVMTYLNAMLKSYNPLTRKDGRDLAEQLSRVQRRKAGLNRDEDMGGIMWSDGVSADILDFGNVVANPPRSQGSRGRVIILDQK
jgi:hypothetical protein